MSANGISTLPTKELRQKAKLDLAAAKRASNGYRRATYDITQLPTQYNDNVVINNPNVERLVQGRPWIYTVPFTFYEAIGSTAPLLTTQYVSGNKIYAYASTYDVPNFQPARVIVNDIEVLNTEGRGHHLVVLDSYGNVISATRYDTYETVPFSGDSGAPGRLALTTALNSVDIGNIIVLVVYDASSFDASARAVLNLRYSSTNNNTWEARRYSHIFIGIKS